MCFQTNFWLTLVTLVCSAAAGLIKVRSDVQPNGTGSLLPPIGLADPSNVSVQRPVFAKSLQIDIDDPYYCVVMIKDCEKQFATQSIRLDHCLAQTKKMEAEAQIEFDKLDAKIAYQDCRIKELNAEWQTVSDELRTGNPYLEPSFMLKAAKRKKGNLPPRHPRSLLVDTSNASQKPAKDTSNASNTSNASQHIQHIAKGSSQSQKPNNDHILSATEQSPPPVDDPLDDEYYYGDQGPVKDPECACFLDDHCQCVAGCRNLCDSCRVQYKSTKGALYQKWKDKVARIRWQEGRIHALEENIKRARIADPQKDYDRDGANMKDKYRVSECGGKTHVVR